MLKIELFGFLIYELSFGTVPGTRTQRGVTRGSRSKFAVLFPAEILLRMSVSMGNHRRCFSQLSVSGRATRL